MKLVRSTFLKKLLNFVGLVKKKNLNVLFTKIGLVNLLTFATNTFNKSISRFYKLHLTQVNLAKVFSISSFINVVRAIKNICKKL